MTVSLSTTSGNPLNALNPGDQLTLTLSGDSFCPSCGNFQTAGIFDIVLDFGSGASLITAQTASWAGGPLPTSQAGAQWLATASAGTCSGAPPAIGGSDTGRCLIMDAFENTFFGALPVDLQPGTIATINFDTSTAGAGDTFSFQASPGPTAGFFGLGSSNTAQITFVPEPGTAGLLGLGLGALAFAGRRRR
jgi:hypothetical protein